MVYSNSNQSTQKPDFSNNCNDEVSCLICHRFAKEEDDSAFAIFPCNVRAFREEKFQVWRCHQCGTIHCLDQVDLNQYYGQYPYADATLNLPFRLFYQKLCQELTQWGFSKKSLILDYGCGNGLLIQYLKEKGFINAYGYDPYGASHSFGNADVLEYAPFNYIILQDVIEHLDDPNPTLEQLDSLLAPGGYIFIGTPNAKRLDLTQPELSDYYNPIHVPYHRHIYTPETLIELVRPWGWEACHFFDRPYSDTRWFSLNTRSWNQYQRLLDGTLNAVFEPIKISTALKSPRFWWYALFGYWQSFHTEMAILFRKIDQ